MSTPSHASQTQGQSSHLTGPSLVHGQAAASASTGPAPTTATATTPTTAPVPHIRIVPHMDAPRSLHFEVVDKDVPDGFVLKIGRFTDKQALPNRVTFKSKVVSRGHAEIFTEQGKFYLRDTKSSSGTFLNHARLSPPGVESKPTLLKDGDVVQLGVDYQGGTQEIYRCVKMRLELNRSWQQKANPFRANTLKVIRSLTTADAASCTDCCICLFRIASFQSLFVAPCSHVFHFKCIRPMLMANHPGFLCPLCRTFADLEDTVEIDDPIEEESPVACAVPAIENGFVESGSVIDQTNAPTAAVEAEQHILADSAMDSAPSAALPLTPLTPDENRVHPLDQIAANPAIDSSAMEIDSGEDVLPETLTRSESTSSVAMEVIQQSSVPASPAPSTTPPASSTSPRQSPQQQAPTTAPMNISAASTSRPSTATSSAQQSPSSAFLNAPSPPMFGSSFGATPIPFQTPSGSFRGPSSSNHHHASVSPSNHMAAAGHMIQNFVRNITIQSRNRSRNNSRSNSLTPQQAASLTVGGSHNGQGSSQAQTEGGTDVFGKTLVVSPPLMMLGRTRTGSSGDGHALQGINELEAVNEMETEGGSVARSQLVSSGSSSSSSSSRSSSGHRGEERNEGPQRTAELGGHSQSILQQATAEV